MKNIDELSVYQKIDELNKCIAKIELAEQEPGGELYNNFLLRALLGDRVATITDYKRLVVRADYILKSTDIGTDARYYAEREYDAQISEALLMFPGYTRGYVEETEPTYGSR